MIKEQIFDLFSTIYKESEKVPDRAIQIIKHQGN